ncbi:Lrp/AsnC family transcriptional regulator [Ignicoccus hospitalis]|uniref:Transcriptional regulator, AsnC family n=1 Tax=Ignicoccus hospitalis (strain KIN4/I / DSM 18386 / JCM 14125) TaxID=453591 RepID=A8A8Q4_IGNH4|nr:Lrp/AsnC family transcriptional regulator [Ignicoccus hospitalis]ABU81306.1 transcriptional regulator, AsnC family [Ignicoccus hospitalis KIN4/I]HIH90390.1 Lrp/AsnC family transcriptional regulator [Desulfurococcaceae archaeon]
MAARRVRNLGEPSIIDFVRSERINDRDKLILKTLLKNSKTTTTDIAEKLNISDVATRRRIKKLEEEGVIRFYTAILNPKKLGFNVVALLLIETEPSSVDEVAKTLAEIPHVVELGTLLGDASVYAVVWAEDLESLENIVKEKIGKVKQIKKIHTYLMAKHYKVNGLPLRESELVPDDGGHEA